MNKFNSRIPRYNDDSDYTTNAPSYYDDLARKHKLLKILSKRIYEYDKTLDNSLETINEALKNVNHKIGEGFNDEINTLLVEWVNDGTLNHIINTEIFNTKVDIDVFNDSIDLINSQLGERVSFVPTLQSLKEVTDQKNKDVVIVNSYYDNVEYGGGGTFYWDDTIPKNNHNGGTIIDPSHDSLIGSSDWYDGVNTGLGCWVRIYTDDVELKWFGAKNDKSLDISYAFQSAINWCSRQLNVGEKDTEKYVEPLSVGFGNYLLEQTINITTNGHYIYGDGESTAIFGDKTIFPVNAPMINIDIPEHGYFRLDQLMLVGAKGGSSEISRIDFIPTLHGIRASRISHSTKGVLSNLNDVSFYGFSRGLELNSSWLLLISSCSFVGSSSNNKNGQGVYLGGGTGSNIPNGFGYNSIKFEKCNFQYLNQVAYANYGRNLTFDNCSLESCHNGIRLNQTRGATMKDNYIEELTGYSFSIGNIYHDEDLTYEKAMEVSLRTSNIVIENNTYQGTATFVSLQGCHKVTVKNNHQNGYNADNETSEIGGNTIAVSNSVVEGRGLLVDCYLEYWKSYQLISTPKVNRPATIFGSALQSIESGTNSLVEMLTNPLMDSGSNERGEYVKLNNGTLICLANNLEISANNNVNLQFPHAFIENTQPIITGSLQSQGYTFYANSSKSTFAVRAVGEPGDVSFSYIAIGRWK